MYLFCPNAGSITPCVECLNTTNNVTLAGYLLQLGSNCLAASPLSRLHLWMRPRRALPRARSLRPQQLFGPAAPTSAAATLIGSHVMERTIVVPVRPFSRTALPAATVKCQRKTLQEQDSFFVALRMFHILECQLPNSNYLEYTVDGSFITSGSHSNRSEHNHEFILGVAIEIRIWRCYESIVEQ
jgi:hypothetical protein